MYIYISKAGIVLSSSEMRVEVTSNTFIDMYNTESYSVIDGRNKDGWTYFTENTIECRKTLYDSDDSIDLKSIISEEPSETAPAPINFESGNVVSANNLIQYCFYHDYDGFFILSPHLSFVGIFRVNTVTTFADTASEFYCINIRGNFMYFR